MKTYNIYNSRIDRFRNREMAFEVANRRKTGMVILGDDSKYWVVCMADAKKSINSGLELA